MSRLAGSTTYATDGVDDGKRATTAMAARAGVEEGGERGGGERGDEGGGVATTTITETLTTKSVSVRARITTRRSERRQRWEEWAKRTCVCAYVCATNWVRENVGAQIGFVLSCDACGGV